MNDLTDRLGRLYSDHDQVVGDDTIAADLERGRHARRMRSARRSSLGAGALIIVTAGALAVGATSGGTGSGPSSGAGTTTAVTQQQAAPRPQVHSATRTHVTRTHAAKPSIALVAYEGRQRKGFDVKEVPEGYVLQGVSGAVLDVAKAGDTSPLDQFVDKLVVTVDNDVTPEGTPVQVGSVTGHYQRGSDGTQQLWFRSGGYLVNVQVWSTINIDREHLIRFAEGITVTKDVELSHG